ncbi:unnamed protein product [Diplocarpon coronariae]|nr:hypothetical protein JHW43_001506 [Diplocarpon mali]
MQVRVRYKQFGIPSGVERPRGRPYETREDSERKRPVRKRLEAVAPSAQIQYSHRIDSMPSKTPYRRPDEPKCRDQDASHSYRDAGSATRTRRILYEYSIAGKRQPK